MLTENLSTLKINRLTEAQYQAVAAAGLVKDNELYLTPDTNELDTTTFLRVSDVGSAVDPNPINADLLGGKPASAFVLKTENKNITISNSEPTADQGAEGDIWIIYEE